MDRLCYLLLCLCVLGAQPVLAAPAKKASVGTAQAKQEVLTALSVGNPGHALEIIDRAYRADPDPAFLYQLGLVAQAQGRQVAALDLYRRYQEIGGAEVSPGIASAIENFAAGVTEAVTVITITARPGLILCVDDQIVGTLPLRTPLLLGGGPHRFRLEDRSERYESGALNIPSDREADLRLTPGAKGTLVALLSLSPITLLHLQPKSLPTATSQAVYKALLDAVRKDHLAPLSRARLDALLRKQPADCMEQPDCQYAIAEEAGARSVLRVVVKETEAEAATPLAPVGSCTATLSYLDVNAGQVTSTAEAKSLLCQGVPLTEALAVVVQQLVTDANSRPRGMVSVSSVPIGARVRVDGLLRGQTPYLKASFGGVHQILVEKTDFHSFRSQVEVILGQVATVQTELTPMPPEPPEPPPAPLQVVEVLAPARAKVLGREPRPRIRLALGGVALGAGILVAGLGISALTLDGQCTGVPAEGAFCRGTYSTAAVGGGLLGAGLALALGSVVLFAVPGPMKKE